MTGREAGSEPRKRRKPTKAEREAAAMASEVARRAIRRLDVLEWVIFFGGAALAVAGGALGAWLLAGIGGWDFRTTWMVLSVALFVVPGAIAILKIRRDEREDARRAASTADGTDR